MWPQTSKELKQHINKLWTELAQNISGYSAPVFAGLLANPGPAPFATWLVEDRYSDGLAITKQDAAGHLSAAAQILGVLQQAELNGYVT